MSRRIPAPGGCRHAQVYVALSTGEVAVLAVVGALLRAHVLVRRHLVVCRCLDVLGDHVRVALAIGVERPHYRSPSPFLAISGFATSDPPGRSR